ncbi:monovalent cation/H+ antiporter subunit D [Oryzicola mucosus]|uniref:Monovalent cation/H+ antiporter subunit D n=1 Tax=Oryzicola mucosus TaxID=2767425 RepID=A0A8J6PS49_9HYPH|nr:monovalent cation/H+ antiporter subunit D [Oryzicola mucosus]MBD0414044.1 monovalent cation/H+ antiporter subunit D [Oryzicola mucosus]
MSFLDHLIIMPILLPLGAAALTLLFDDTRREIKAGINFAATILLVAVAIALLMQTDAVTREGTELTVTYQLGNWPAPFGIVLVADRLSAIMVLLAGILGINALIYSMARWQAAGPHFHMLFQMLLMGLNGAFLTGDLFNLFVFFEVMLAASYGLLLHGSGVLRVRAGLHYIAINLAASSLFLIGVSLIYGVTGTLNMADLALRIPHVPANDLGLLHAGAAILGIAFLVKAGMWPLNFWLPTTYAAASAPVAGLFAIMTKVGVYIVLRLTLLLFGEHAGASFGFGQTFLMIGGLATIAFGTVGVLASQSTGRLAGYSVLVSSGTLLAAIGMGDRAVTGGLLFYLVSSTLTISAFLMLVELIERARVAGADVLAVTMEAYGEDDEELEHEEEVGVVIPSTMAILGVCFALCGLLLSGVPPFSGFISKFAMLSAVLQSEDAASPIPASTWWLIGLLIISGLASLIAMTRTGIATFWATLEGQTPSVRVIEIAPIAILIALCLGLTVAGGPVLRFMDLAADALHTPTDYIEDIIGTTPAAHAGGAS